MAKKICARCRAEIDTEENGYVTCLDNFLQLRYFDSDECNTFCSEECACESMSIVRVYDE